MTCFAPALTANLEYVYQQVLACGAWRGGVREHAEDGCAASDVEDDLVLEQVPVLVDRVAVALGADLVFLRGVSIWSR